MKQLICELCGSTDFLKQDGAFVCQSCGCKYSVEEARKMMADGPVEVTGTIQVDRRNEQKQLIDNYLKMCETAHESMDTSSVVEYSDKILEIDPNNYEAWVYRALSCGWDSSLNNLKTGQVITAAKRALELAPEEKRYDLATKIFLQGKLQVVAHLKTVFSLSSTALLTLSITMVTKQAEMAAPVMSGWVRLVSEIPYLPPEVIEAEIEDCKLIEERHSIVIGTASSVSNGNQPYHETMRTLAQPKIELLSKERDAVYARKREEYWAAHPEEKQELEAKKADLEAQKAEASAPIAAAEETVAQLTAKAKELSDQYAATSIFKFKESRAITAQMDENGKQLSAAKKALAEAQAAVQDATAAIEDQLTKIEAKLQTPFL